MSHDGIFFGSFLDTYVYGRTAAASQSDDFHLLSDLHLPCGIVWVR
jgi:hypothetical protein